VLGTTPHADLRSLTRDEAAAITALGPNRSLGDTFEVRGREIYLRLPRGHAKTKLTNPSFDDVPGTPSTIRNLRTITTLVDLAAAPSSRHG